MSNDSGWRRFQFRKKPTIIAAAVAGAVVVSGAAVSAATIGPGQDGSITNAALAGALDRDNQQVAYNANNATGTARTDLDQRLLRKAVHKSVETRRDALQREKERERARKRARALAKKRAAERAKKAREAREARASRSSDRAPVAPSDSGSSGGSAPSGSPKAIAKQLLADRGWSGQFGCLDSLWTKESGWSVHAANPSGAYGIPQALPGSKMSSAGPDWESNAATQIKWGLGYIKDRYGGPCAAWNHSQANNWY